MLKYVAILTVMTSLLMSGKLFSQERKHKSPPGLKISGNVYDRNRQEPLEYANIVVYKQSDSTQVTGTVSNIDGDFRIERIRPGLYYVKVRYIGYIARYISDVRVTPRQPVDLGRIQLEEAYIDMEAVAVEGEKAAMTYLIDKKVINVGQQQTVISGNAADVLENVPSVSVDIEGNVSLRGSTNFTVLLDGRPTILEPSELLQQIPASTIESIEIITNPSAKYDPEGTAGIINIILAKNKRSGRSGVINLNGGFNGKYGTDVLLQYRTRKYQATVGVDYNRRYFTGTTRTENETYRAGQTSFINSSGNTLRGRKSLGLRGELAWSLSPNDVLSVGGRYGDRTAERDSDLNYDQWAEPDLQHALYASDSDHERSGNSYSANLSLQHKFARKGHELYIDTYFSSRNSDEFSLNARYDEDGNITSGRRSLETGPSSRFRAKLDYTLPFHGETKLEAGYQAEVRSSTDDTGLLEYDMSLGEYVRMDQFNNSTEYERTVHSLYAIYAGELKKLNYQAGLRGEYTNRTVAFSGAPSEFKIDRWDYFPTVHVSYNLPAAQQLMASYTRRIRRPRGWFLEPFETWTDAFNVRTGNPALKPSYIDSYELGYQRPLGSSLFSTELYHRVNHNKMERVRSVYADNVTLHTTANVGTDYSTGVELMLNLDVNKVWNVNLMGNIYDYRVEGSFNGISFDRSDFSWTSRLNNAFKLGGSTSMQFNGHYRSPQVSSQGRWEGFFSADVSLRHQFFAKGLTATLQVRDVFSTSKYEQTFRGADFYSYQYAERESQIVMLNLRYNFNRHEPERRRAERPNGGDREGEDEF